MILKDFMLAKRLASKFQTYVDIAAYAKTRGHTISSESLRLIEKGERVPNAETRAILIDIYKLTPDDVITLNRLCATEMLSREFPTDSFIPVSLEKIKTFADSLDECFRYIPNDKKKTLVENTPWMKTQLK